MMDIGIMAKQRACLESSNQYYLLVTSSLQCLFYLQAKYVNRWDSE